MIDSVCLAARATVLYNPRMTRSELIEALAARFPQLTAQDADVAVKELLDAITEALIKGQRIEIRGFGSFSLKYRPPRTGRNPKTGEKVDVAAKYVPHFKPGKELRDRVDATLVVPIPFRKVA
jgi:integration host factor subunit beta